MLSTTVLQFSTHQCEIPLCTKSSMSMDILNKCVQITELIDARLSQCLQIFQVMLKMKSKHVAGTITKKKKSKLSLAS